MAQRVLNEFVVLYRCLETAIGDSSPADDLTKREIGRRVQEELLPYILLAKTAERCLSKPRGYAGDYWTIEPDLSESGRRMGPRRSAPRSVGAREPSRCGRA